MASYIAAFNGYIADVPELWFKRCDGRIFHYDQLTSANMNIQQNTIDVNAGQDLFPVATLPGTSTCELTCTLGNFDTSLFELSEAVNFAENTSYEEYFTEKLAVDAATHTVTLAKDASTYPVSSGSATETYYNVSIAGLTQVAKGGTVQTGQFVCSSSTTGTIVTTITFFAGDVDGKEIEINYQAVNDKVKEIVVDNKASAIGTAVAKYPVYSSGEDCTVSGISGNVIVRIFRCRVTGHPTLGGQYKSAATYDITFSAIKNNSTDNKGKAYSIAYYPAS